MNIEATEKFLNDIVEVIKTRFPNSRIFWKKVCFYGTYYHIYFYLAKNENEVSSGIMKNDAMDWCFVIDAKNTDDNGCLNDEITIELNRNYIIRIADKNDEKEKYCVYGSVKVPYRKIKGNAEKCIQKMKNFIDKTAEIIIENADVINQGIIKGIFTVADKVK